MAEKRHRYKGVIIDGRVYIAVKDTHYYRLRERCELARDGLSEDGSLGARLSNAFTEHFHVPLRFRFSQELTDALAALK